MGLPDIARLLCISRGGLEGRLQDRLLEKRKLSRKPQQYKKTHENGFFFPFLTPLLLCFCPSSPCLSPHRRRKRKYVTLMDSNFDKAYPEDLPFGYISSRDLSSIRSDSINHSGHTDIFINNWFFYDVVSVTRGLVIFN
jgi:hypothetical protein